jgi:hypothetical protein
VTNKKPERNAPEWRARNNARRRERYDTDPEVRRKAKEAANKQRETEDPAHRRDLRLRRTYGITSEQYDEMLEAQGGVCAICGRPPKNMPLNVDHDHKTGLVRGLICWSCNHRVLGAVRDSIELLRAAMEYLVSPPSIPVIGEVIAPARPKRKRRTKKTKEKELV